MMSPYRTMSKNLRFQVIANSFPTGIGFQPDGRWLASLGVWNWQGKANLARSQQECSPHQNTTDNQNVATACRGTAGIGLGVGAS